MRILAISGSLRRDSHNTKLLRAAAGLLPPGAELEVLEPDVLRAIPHYDEDLREAGEPASVAALREPRRRARTPSSSPRPSTTTRSPAR